MTLPSQLIIYYQDVPKVIKLISGVVMNCVGLTVMKKGKKVEYVKKTKLI